MGVVPMRPVGCGGGEKQSGPVGSKFVGGQAGLAMSFAAGSIPDKVLDKDQPFSISVVLTNKGDHTRLVVITVVLTAIFNNYSVI